MHTKGPWGYIKRSSSFRVAAGACQIADTVSASVQSEANALLIAAAPELLAACKAAASVMEDGDNHLNPETGEYYRDYQILKEAIAKAEGTTN